MFKYEVGDICMIKNAPEAYDELNGWVVTLRQASLFFDVESWYTVCRCCRPGCTKLLVLRLE